MNQESDQYYIEKVLSGDTQAFSVLVKRYQDQSYGLALRLTGNKFDAEEIAQDAFMKAYKSLQSFKQKSKFSTWLYRIVYNTAITKLRKNKKFSDDLQINEVTENEMVSSLNVFGQICQEERQAHLNKAIETLADEEKFLLHLYYTEDKSVKEITEIMNMTEENVKIKLFRIRKRLLQTLTNSLKNEIFDIYG